MPRQVRLDSPGTLHHVIVRGIERRQIVDDEKDRKNFVDRIGSLASETGTAIYSWALLMNHAHILLRSGPLGLSKYMKKFLTSYAVFYNRRHRRHGHLFNERISRVRARLVEILVEKFGLSLAEAGRQLGVSSSAVAITLYHRNAMKN